MSHPTVSSLPLSITEDLLPLPHAFWQRRHAIPCASLQQTPRPVLVHTTPLLEKERHRGPLALVAEVDYPCGIHGPRPWSRLTADDDLVDAPQVEVR
jgi:hypothetical protein